MSCLPIRMMMVLLASVVFIAPSRAEDPLAEKVRKAIDAGKAYLHQQQVEVKTPSGPGGHWEIGIQSKGRPGGWTSLALLALLNCGEKPDSPVITRGLRYLRTIEPVDTYVVGLQTMVFMEAKQAQDKTRIQRNVDWLRDNRIGNKGWGYNQRSLSGDNSNTQYALLGLWAGKVAGAKIDKAFWQSIQDFYIKFQEFNGGWSYVLTRREARLTMTTAGLCGLYIAGMELDKAQQKLNEATGVAASCGKYAQNKNAVDAIRYISTHFQTKQRGAVFYNLYGIERAGRLSGMRFFGEHDWYRTGCRFLVEKNEDGYQKENGSWYMRGRQFDSWPVVSTSFALLFLSKGRTPILVSKLVHGPEVPNRKDIVDWNRKHNDLRNLVQYASKNLFKDHPLGWQNFNARRAVLGNLEDRQRIVGELLQSPIAYISGHEAPRLAGNEQDMLHDYLDQGGFLLAEACCGSGDFDKGFRALMKTIFKDEDVELKKLGPKHPIWQAHFPIAANREFELWGIERGCKTVVVYSPKPISGYWEANLHDRGRGRAAFRLAGNIIAYATGMELPKPKGVEVEVIRDRPELKVPRGFVKVAQIRHGGDWHPAPRAMRNLMSHLKQKAGLDASLKTQDIFPDDKNLLNFKFMYMHGRSDPNIQEARIIKANLETGGLLLADACCGKKAFDTGFREFIEKVFGKGKKLEPIPLDDPLFGKELNGSAIKLVRCRRERIGGGKEFQNVAPALEGIKIGNRWAVIYSKYDLGCALEKHQSTDCLGHDHESALRLAGAALLYALQR